jgi:GT2 family glycosyltransferase
VLFDRASGLLYLKVAPDWLKSLVGAAEKNSKIGIVTSKILRLDKVHLDSTGEFLTIWGMPFPRGRNEVDTRQYDKSQKLFAASGGASLYSRQLFDDIGLFDEDFFAYFEDVDISFRAQLRGWQVRYCPSAQVYHHVNATSSKLGSFSYYHTVKNFMLLYAKNMPLSLYLKYGPLFCIQFMRLFLAGAKRKMPFVFVRGVYGAVKLHFKTVKKRREIQKTSLVSARYIDSLLVHHRPPRPPEIKQAGEV